MSNLNIRPFEPTDEAYEAIVAIWNASWPQWLKTADEAKIGDAQRAPDSFWGRVVGEVNGRVVAYANFGEVVWANKPGKYSNYIVVLPQFRNQGIGTALYDHVFDTLQKRDLFTTLAIEVVEDQTNTLNALKRRNFQQVMRFPLSELDVTSFDAERFIPKMEKTMASGIELCTVSELKKVDPDWKQKLYELECAIVEDTPSPDPITPQPFAQFEKMLTDPRLSHNAIVVAVDNGRYVGFSELLAAAAMPTKLSTGLTGVLRSHRRRGLATALKTKSILYADSLGVTCIETDNEENNPMFQINRQLGFKPLPAVLEFHKKIKGKNHEPPDKN